MAEPTLRLVKLTVEGDRVWVNPDRVVSVDARLVRMSNGDTIRADESQEEVLHRLTGDA